MKPGVGSPLNLVTITYDAGNRPANPSYARHGSLIPDRTHAVPGDRSCARVDYPQNKNRGSSGGARSCSASNRHQSR